MLGISHRSWAVVGGYYLTSHLLGQCVSLVATFWVAIGARSHDKVIVLQFFIAIDCFLWVVVYND